MTREEYLRRASEIHARWSLRYADRIEPVLSESNPHGGPGADSDFAEHHHDVSATSTYADLLDEELVALTQEYRANRTG